MAADRRRRAEMAAAGLCCLAAGYILIQPQTAAPLAGAPFLLLAGLLMAMVAWIAIQDVADLTIPDGPVIGIAVLALADHLRFIAPFTLAQFGRLSLDPALGLIVGGGGLLAVREVYYRRHGRDGIGFGDVKLAAACGLLLGASGFAWALLAASLAGLGLAAIAALRERRWPERLPFGALLAPICWCIWLVLR